MSRPPRPTSSSRSNCSGGVFDWEPALRKLDELNARVEDPTLWDNPAEAQAVSRDRSRLAAQVEAVQSLERDLEDALKGDEPAAARLEKALPLVHHRLREQLAALPNAIGAPRLRLILALFDDAVMPVPVTAVEEGRVIPALGRRGR